MVWGGGVGRREAAWNQERLREFVTHKIIRKRIGRESHNTLGIGIL
jgi:hypothetical protein